MWLSWLTYNYIDIYRIAGYQSFTVYDCRRCDFIFETYSKCQATYITLIGVVFFQSEANMLFENLSSCFATHGALYIWDLDNSYPSQLAPRTTRIQDNSYPGQLVPRQLVPRTTSTQVNSYPGHLVPRPLVPMTIRIQDNSYSRQPIPKTVPTQGMSYLRQLINANSHRPNHNHTTTHGYLFRNYLLW